MESRSARDGAFVAVGSARLPKTLSGDLAGVLLVELSLDPKTGHIVDVYASLPLPGYVELLRRLLVGRCSCDAQHAFDQLGQHLRGALLKPTVAALIDALANGVSHADHED